MKCMEPGCIGKYHTNNLPVSTNLTRNPHRKVFVLFLGESKIGLRCSMRYLIWIRNMEADLKCFFLIFEIRGGTDAQKIL